MLMLMLVILSFDCSFLDTIRCIVLMIACMIYLLLSWDMLIDDNMHAHDLILCVSSHHFCTVLGMYSTMRKIAVLQTGRCHYMIRWDDKMMRYHDMILCCLLYNLSILSIYIIISIYPSSIYTYRHPIQVKEGSGLDEEDQYRYDTNTTNKCYYMWYPSILLWLYI